MREWSGLPFASIPPPESPDFLPRLRNMMGTLDLYLRDASAAFQRLSNGQVPTGSGTSVVTAAIESSTTESGEYVTTGGEDQTILGTKRFTGQLQVGFDQTNVGTRLVVQSDLAELDNLQEWLDKDSLTLASIDPNGTFVCYSLGTVPPATQTRMGVDISGLPSAVGPALDDGSGFVGEFQLPSASLTADRVYIFPDATGTLIVSGALATLVGASGSTLDSNTAASGASFRDVTNNAKKLRFVLSGASANGHSFVLTNAAARAYAFTDQSGSVVQVGNTTSASGVLGRSVLTGQTASIGATTLLTGNATSAGLYRVSFYLTTTTAGDGGDTVLVTVAWNDGAAQTFVSANLDAGTLNAYLQFSVVVRAAASQNITFTTTLTSPGAGTPAHTLDARIEALG